MQGDALAHAYEKLSSLHENRRANEYILCGLEADSLFAALAITLSLRGAHAYLATLA